MLNRLLLVIAIVGLGLCVYLVARPSTVQTVRLEPSLTLPSQLDTPQPAPKLEVKPAPTPKPRSTQAIAPQNPPKLPTKPSQSTTSTTPNRENDTPVASASRTAASSPSAAPSTTQNFRDFDNPTALTPTKILTPRADGAVWRLQVGAFRSTDNAELLQKKLLEQGLSVKIVQGTDSISRVLVGDYATREAAQADNKAVSSRLP